MTHRLKWRIAMKQSARADASGIRFDLLTYDDRGQRFVAEVSASISVHAAVRVEAVQVDVLLPGMHVIFGTRVAIIRAVTAPQHWRAIIWRMRVLERWLTLVAAVGELTGEMK